jgi:hypothetical protein
MNREPGMGETLERQRVARFRRRSILGGCLGVTLGFASGFFDSPFFAAATGAYLMAPAWAIAAVALWTVLIALDVWEYRRGSYDELQLAEARFACCCAAIAFVIGYPIWCLLWAGGLVVEPSHEAIAVGLGVAGTLGYYWKRYR